VGKLGLVVRFIYSLILAAGIGYLTAKQQISRVADLEATQVGSWKTFLADKDRRDPSGFVKGLYVRASVSLGQGLPVDSSEELVFVATRDLEGKPLTVFCPTNIGFEGFQEAQWSLAAHSEEKAVTLVKPDPKIRLSKELTIPQGGPFDGDTFPPSYVLVLRIYRPSEEFHTLLKSDTPPSLPLVRQEACT
jgi:hypothetical protein